MTRTSEPSRRDLLRAIGTGTAALAFGCGDNLVTTDAAAAILEPSTDGFLVAVWARHARRATLTIRDGAAVALRTLALGAGGSGAVDVGGLAPDTPYEIVVRTDDGATLGPYRARTAPRDDDRRRVRIAVAADVDPNPEFDSELAEHVVAAEPELLVTLGDFPYTDNGPVAVTLDEYRARHVECRTHGRVRTLLEAMPVRAIYDDHEFRNNWDAGFAASEAARYAAAMTAWDEFFPVRAPRGEVRYRRWRWGAHVECFLLDCRRFRSANAAPDDAAKTMLGSAQRDWLIEGVTGSTATFKLVFTSVPLDFTPGVDAWPGFTTERARILDALVGVPGILFVSADQHFFAAYRHAHGIREVQIGPLARGLGTPVAQGAGVLFRAERYNVGLLDIDGDRLVVAGLGADGARFYEETLTPDALTPRPL